MYDKKFWLSSLSVLAMLTGLLVQLAPMIGLNFTPDDAHLINDSADKLMTIVLELLGLFGRLRATKQLTVLPNSNTTFKAHPIIIMLAVALVLSACSPAQVDSVKVKFERAQTALLFAKVAIGTYAAYPDCDPASPRVRVCKDPEVATNLQNTLVEVEGAVNLARGVLTGAEAGDRDSAVSAAAIAAVNLLTLLASVGR